MTMSTPPKKYTSPPSTPRKNLSQDSFRSVSFRDPFSPQSKIEDPNVVALLPAIVAGSSVEDYIAKPADERNGKIELKRHWKTVLILMAVILNCSLTTKSMAKYILREYWVTKTLADCSKLEDLRPHLFFAVAVLEFAFLVPDLLCVLNLRVLVSGPRDLDHIDADAWKGISKGCKAVEALSTMSALRLLPQVEARTERYWQKIKEVTHVSELCGKVCIPLLSLLCYFMGAVALYAKIESLELDVFDKNLSEWVVFGSLSAMRPWKWPLWKYINFVNQIKGVVNIEEVRKRAVENFMFAGEDADLQPEEEERMLDFEGHLCKHICARPWHTYSLMGFCSEMHWVRKLQLAWCRFAVCTTLSAKDLQRLVLKERDLAWKMLVRKVLDKDARRLKKLNSVQDLVEASRRPLRHRNKTE